MAYRQVVEYGMSPTIGHISLPHKKPSDPAKRMYSDKLARMIDKVCIIARVLYRIYSLIYSRIKDFAVWLDSAQKQIFTDKIFVVERLSPVRIQQVPELSWGKTFVVYE